MTPRKIQRYGWKRDLPDHRDHLYAAPLWKFPRPTPPRFSLVPECPPVYDQGELGSCTANAIAACDQFVMLGEDATKAFQPARLAIYYDERVIEGTTGYDSGAQLRDGIKVVATKGAAPEDLCPYDVGAFTQEPSAAYYDEAAKHPTIAYARVAQTLSQLRGAILARHPVVFGFTVYDSFESHEVAASGDVPMPSPGEQVLGGHAVMIVGYDDTRQRFIVRNSWGPGWGQAGYFTMPYGYVLDPNLASDFWIITRTVE